MELNYEEIFKTPLLAMRITRAHPEIKRDVKWGMQFLLFHGVYSAVFLIIMYNIFLNLKDNDFSETCKNGTLAILYVVVSLEYCTMLWKQPYLLELMNDMKDDYIRAYDLSENELESIRKYAREGAGVCKTWFYISLMALVLFLLKNIGLVMYYFTIDGTFHLIPYYDLVYPSFIEEKKNDLLVFVVLYNLLLFYGTYSAVVMAGCVPLGMTFMLHACGQLEVIIARTELLFKNDDSTRNIEILKDIINRLQYIYDFVERTNLCFRVAYELTLKATTIILPITSYEVLESLKKGEVSMEFIMFVIGGCMLSSSPCFYSEVLMEKGEKFRTAMYTCGWEKMYDRRTRSTVRFILMRAQRPIVIRILFQTVSLNALADLFHQSYAIFNLMNAAWK